jgi:hypothetical protein
MKQEKQLIKWVEEMYHKYKSTLFIEKYHLKVRIKEKDEDYYLASKFNYPYLDLTIIYSAEFLKDWQKNKKDAERRIIHEFCHAITDPFYATVINWPTRSKIEDERERLNDHIAQIVNKHFQKLSK